MNVVIFGYGYMGKIRCQVLRRHPSVRDVYVVDPALDGVPPGAAAIFLNSSAGIPWNEIDAAFVCTPPHVTVDLCVDALRRNKHVFCEKPPGRSWEDFARIADAAETSAGRILVFGFNHRLHPSIQAARKLVGESGLGEILYLKGTYGKSGGQDYRKSWRCDPDIAGGGILLDQGIHMLDIFHFFAGPLTVVDAVLTDTFWKCGGEDNAFVLLRSEQGAPVFLHSSATLWKHTFRLEIGCADGYLVASGLLSQTGSYGREQLVIGKRQFEDEAMALGNPREEIIHFDRDESWEKEVHEFIAAIAEGRTPTHGTLQDAQHAMELVRDAYALTERHISRDRV